MKPVGLNTRNKNTITRKTTSVILDVHTNATNCSRYAMKIAASILPHILPSPPKITIEKAFINVGSHIPRFIERKGDITIPASPDNPAERAEVTINISEVFTPSSCAAYLSCEVASINFPNFVLLMKNITITIETTDTKKAKILEPGIISPRRSILWS